MVETLLVEKIGCFPTRELGVDKERRWRKSWNMKFTEEPSGCERAAEAGMAQSSGAWRASCVCGGWVLTWEIFSGGFWRAWEEGMWQVFWRLDIHFSIATIASRSAGRGKRRGKVTSLAEGHHQDGKCGSGAWMWEAEQRLKSHLPLRRYRGNWCFGNCYCLLDTLLDPWSSNCTLQARSWGWCFSSILHSS